MKKIEFSETTLTSNASFSFKEKIEIARCLDRMRADAIEIAPVENERTDTLFVRTASALVKNTTLSIGVGYTEEGVELARTALEKAKKARYRVEVPVSPIQMEFVFHKKPKAALEAIAALVSKCRSYGSDIEFVAVDATRAEAEFLREAIKCAIESGRDSRVRLRQRGSPPSRGFCILRLRAPRRRSRTVRDPSRRAGIPASSEWLKAHASPHFARARTTSVQA